jgi:3-hydroxyisobutyrate dehydrogenase
MENPLIGWVGLGNMGNAMVQNLLRKGFTVYVYNRTKEKEEEVVQAGAKSQDSLQQLVHNSSIIFTMLSDDDAVKEVYGGDEGLLSHAPSGKIFVDMSTVSPGTSEYLAELCNNSRNEFLDAPVSGSIKPAADGTLLILAGGPEQTFEKVKPVFDALGRKTFHLGGISCGTSAKVAINYFLAATLEALAETVVLAKKNGIHAKDILSILNESALASVFTRTKTNNILNDTYDPTFQLKHVVKDLKLAHPHGTELPLYDSLFESFLEATENGYGEEDCMAIFKHLDEQYSDAGKV